MLSLNTPPEIARAALIARVAPALSRLLPDGQTIEDWLRPLSASDIASALVIDSEATAARLAEIRRARLAETPAALPDEVAFPAAGFRPGVDGAWDDPDGVVTITRADVAGYSVFHSGRPQGRYPSRQAAIVAARAFRSIGAPTVSEAKRPTDDGYLWPVPRERMRDARRIVARMAEDIERHIRSLPEEPMRVDDLHRLGWTLNQLAVHGARAREIALRTATLAAREA